MVCKNEVLSWFKELNIFKRLDFVCALMDCCNPIELRFLGTYVEDLGRKDYDRLREFQIHASNVQYLSKLTDVNDIRTLDKMLTSLALMDSTFKEGAEVIFDILKQHTDTILYSYQTSVSIERVVLLAVMAVNHPAFEFSQKQALRTQLSVLLQAVEVNDAACNQCDNINDPIEEASPCSEEILVAQPSIKQVHSNKVFVQSIEVKGYNRSSDKRYEYTFQITWSDNTVTCVSKTHVQLFEFQCKLLNLFPEQAGEHKSMMPYLGGKRISSTAHKGELAEKTLPDIEEYVRQLSTLPQHILQCQHVVSFFSPSSAPTPGSQPVLPGVIPDEALILPDTNTPANVDYKQQVVCDQLHSGTLDHVANDLNEPAECLRSNDQPNEDYAPDACQFATPPACHKDSDVNVELAPGYHIPNDTLVTSIENSSKMVYSTTVTSPSIHATNIPANPHHIQPICPQGSYDNQRVQNRRDGIIVTSPRVLNSKTHSRQAWPAYNQAISSHVLYGTQLQVMPYPATVASDMVAPLIQEWLKKQRLHKYNALFQGMTVEQVLKLSEQEIDSWEIVTGAKGRIKTQLEQLRKNGFSELNGLAASMPPYYPVAGSPNRIYYGPVNHGLYHSDNRLPPHGLSLPVRHTSETASSDASSPLSSSSDENERDSEGSENSIPETKMASSSATCVLPTSSSSSSNIATLHTPVLNSNCVAAASPQLSPVHLSQPTLNTKRTDAPVFDDHTVKLNMPGSLPLIPDASLEMNTGQGQTFSNLPESRNSVDCASGKPNKNKLPVYSSSLEYRLNPAPLVVEQPGQDLRYPCYTEAMNRGCVTNSSPGNRVDITFGNVPLSLASPCGRTGEMPQVGTGIVGSKVPVEHTPYSVARTMYSPSSQSIYPSSSQHQTRVSSETYIAPTTVTFSTTTAPVLALGNNSTYTNESTLGITYNNNHTTYGTNSLLACTTCNSSIPCGNAPPHSNLHVPYNSYVPQGAIAYQNFSNYYHQGGIMQPNSLINQGIPSSPRYANVPPPPFQNNLAGELAAYGNGHYGIMHQHGHMYVGMGIGHRPGPTHHGHLGNPGMVSKKMTCYNCGLPGHKATECREQCMQTITQQSQYNLNFKPIEHSESSKS
ncbi:zinc finger CCHC domain-containing protein 14-like [Anneissia japonica]|uniref:zinc finger CCHC domain-containing protein 14-like n=1 Tax=Anneissia japonica TaxID=1529436 RepID=UPI001425B59F|nr:zinc finger CCHC domain-containing protein 14-like [Anneissia japonica]